LGAFRELEEGKGQKYSSVREMFSAMGFGDVYDICCFRPWRHRHIGMRLGIPFEIKKNTLTSIDRGRTGLPVRGLNSTS
jgi:hypothetical protein